MTSMPLPIYTNFIRLSPLSVIGRYLRLNVNILRMPLFFLLPRKRIFKKFTYFPRKRAVCLPKGVAAAPSRPQRLEDKHDTAVDRFARYCSAWWWGVYFFRQLRRDRAAGSMRREANAEMEHVRRLRSIRLSQPLNESVRPRSFAEIVGQEEGGARPPGRALRGEPQHVLIYGPPGVGKTCAARLALEAAKRSEGTPFRADAPFIEMDATCLRFDERAIADPALWQRPRPHLPGCGAAGPGRRCRNPRRAR